MAVDLGVFGRQKTVLDQQALQQAFEAKKQLIAQQAANQQFNQQLAIQQLGLQNRQASRQDDLFNLQVGKAISDDFNNQPRTATEVNPGTDLIRKMIQIESGGNPNAVSPKGAQGVMQIMPATAADPGYGVAPLANWDGKNPMSAPVEEQIRFGTDYVNAMQNKFGPTLGAAAYNAGPGAVQNAIGVNPNQPLAQLPTETQNYVAKLSPYTSPQSNQQIVTTPMASDMGGATPPQQQPASDIQPLFKNGAPYTTGAPKGFMWGKDSQGNFKALPIEGTGEGSGGFKNENTLRDEFNTLTKDFRTVQDAYTKIKGTSSTGAGDMSMLYAYVKLLDPGSVVRESEFATAAASGSFGERIRGAVKSIEEGGRLPPSLRADFMSEAGNIYNGQKQGYDRIKTNYSSLAERNRLKPENVVVDYAAPEQTQAAPQLPAGITPQDWEEYRKLRGIK